MSGLDRHGVCNRYFVRVWKRHLCGFETEGLEDRVEVRFALVFTPKHDSWLNLVEGFFSNSRVLHLIKSNVLTPTETRANASE
jgi:hypothetical protein